MILIAAVFCIFITNLPSCYTDDPQPGACLQFLNFSTPSIIQEIAAGSQLCLQVPEVPSYVRFFIVEAHSQKRNITLSYLNSSESTGNVITGTDVGLVSRIEDRVYDTFWLFNQNQEEINVLITIVPYQENDPIPGGCNMEFPIETSPFLRLMYNKAYTRLEFQHAQVGYPSGTIPPLCSLSINFISYKFYINFLPERDFSEETFFNHLSTMQDVSSIKENAKEINPYIVTPRTRATFMSYPGQGIIFNIIAQTSNNGVLYEAAYTPAATYGCSFDLSIDGCGRLTGPFGKILALVLAALGLFIAARGHRYLTLEMAYFGFLAGSLITFILLAKYSSVTDTDRDVLTVTGGVVGALIWAAVWWCFGIPVLSILLVGFVLGFLLTSVIYFTPAGNAELFRNDFNYWMIMACGMLAVPVLLLPTTRTLSILGSSIVGSYFIVVAVDRFTGSTISYIVLNVVKRALAEDTSLASNFYAFQETDIILSVVWVVLSLTGTILQLYMERNRAPFPPPPRKTWRREFQQRRERRLARLASLGVPDREERAPLIGSTPDLHYDSTTISRSR